MALEKPLFDSPLVFLHHLPFVTAPEVDEGQRITEECILHFSVQVRVRGEAWRVVYLPGGASGGLVQTQWEDLGETLSSGLSHGGWVF